MHAVVDNCTLREDHVRTTFPGKPVCALARRGLLTVRGRFWTWAGAFLPLCGTAVNAAAGGLLRASRRCRAWGHDLGPAPVPQVTARHSGGGADAGGGTGESGWPVACGSGPDGSAQVTRAGLTGPG